VNLAHQAAAAEHPQLPFNRLDYALKNCANSLYICGVNRIFCVNEINNLAPGKTGCESCRPSQFQAKLSILSAPPEGAANIAPIDCAGRCAA
jgi:hypothetical protein